MLVSIVMSLVIIEDDLRQRESLLEADQVERSDDGPNLPPPYPAARDCDVESSPPPSYISIFPTLETPQSIRE